MECERCGDRGFTEQEHGLVQIACDCEKGKALSAEIIGRPVEEGGILTKEHLDNAQTYAKEEMAKAEAREIIKASEGKRDDSNSGTESDNQPDRGTNSGQSQQPKKRKTKKRTAKKSR